MGRRTGFTLVELLMVVLIVSIMTLMAFPRANSAINKSNLRSARTRLANMLATARAAATLDGRTNSWLRFNGNMAVVTASPRRQLPIGANTEDTLGVVFNVNTTYGAALTTGGVTAVQYDPRGMATGFASGGWYLKVSKGSYRDSLKVDQLGRVTK